MNWVTSFLTSSIGRKLVMSLTGLFLVSFLFVHLSGNLQLFMNDGGQAFNIYAEFMAHNPVIKFISFGLYAGILLHAIQGILLWSKNRKAAAGKYAVAAAGQKDVSWASKQMALLGILILAFLFLHMGDFWWKIKIGLGTDPVPQVMYDGESYGDVYTKIKESFSQLWIVICYVIGLIALAFHLQHGWTSAFQTLGLNHKKYNPLIKGLGFFIAYIIPAGFAAIPIYMYIQSLS